MTKLTFEQFQATRTYCTDLATHFKTDADMYVSLRGFLYADKTCYIEMLGDDTTPFSTAQWQVSLPLSQNLHGKLEDAEKELYEDWYLIETEE